MSWRLIKGYNACNISALGQYINKTKNYHYILNYSFEYCNRE